MPLGCKGEPTITDGTTGNQAMTVWPFMPQPVVFDCASLVILLRVH